MSDCEIGIDNGIVVIGASKCSRERIVNTLGIIKRHLNNIKNTSPSSSSSTRSTSTTTTTTSISNPFSTNDTVIDSQAESSDNDESSTWRVSPIKLSTSTQSPRAFENVMSTPEGGRRTLLRSTTSEYSPYSPQQHKPVISSTNEYTTPPPSPKATFTAPVPNSNQLAADGVSSSFQHSQHQHAAVLNNPLADRHSRLPMSYTGSMDVDIIGLSVVVEDISSIMNRMTLFVDPNCGNMLRFSGEQPMLGSSLLTLATLSELQSQNESNASTSGERNDYSKVGGKTLGSDNISVVCHSTSRISSLLNSCDNEDRRLSEMVANGEVDGVLCLQTDVEELLHSRTIRASIAARLPIVAVGLASAQQIIQMGGRVIACYDLSLAPLASSALSLSPFIASTTNRSNERQSNRRVMTASYAYFLPAEQLCDESLGYYVASSFASYWHTDKAYTIPQPRKSLILDNIVRRTLLLLVFITLFHWILLFLGDGLNFQVESGEVKISLLQVLNISMVITQPYMYFAMIIFSYTCMHFAYPIEDFSSLSPRKNIKKRYTRQHLFSRAQRQSLLYRTVSWHCQFIFYKHSRKYMCRLIMTACLYVYLMKYTLFASLLLPVNSSDDHASKIHVCSRYALSIAFALGTLCGTVQYFTNLMLRKMMQKTFQGACDMVSIAFSFLATATFALLVIRSFKINVYEALMLSARSTVESPTSHFDSISCSFSSSFGSENFQQCALPTRVNWLHLFENSAIWFLPPAFSRFLVTISVAITHLFHVCISQMLDMFGVVVSSSEDNMCKLGSFFWQVAANSRSGIEEYFPVPEFLVSVMLAVFSLLVSFCSVMYIERKAFFVLLIPAMLLDMDQLTSPVTVSTDRQEIFYRVRAVCCLYLPYAGVITAIAMRSIIRTESLFMYYEYLHLFVAKHTKSGLHDNHENIVLVKQESSLTTSLRELLKNLSWYLPQDLINTAAGSNFIRPKRGNRKNSDEILLDLGESSNETRERKLSGAQKSLFGMTKDDFEEDGSFDSDDNYVRGSQLKYDPRLVVQVLWDFLRSRTSRSRVARMVCDWIYMRDCLVELQLCSQHNYYLVKLICLRVVPCLVAARIFLVNAQAESSSGHVMCEFFSLILHTNDQQQGCLKGDHISTSVWFVTTMFDSLLCPFGSFVVACLFTLFILCLPNPY